MIKFNGTRLKMEIVKSGKSQNEVAAALGVHHNTLSQWIREIITPSAEKLAATLIILGWTTEEIDNMPFGIFYEVTAQEATQ